MLSGIGALYSTRVLALAVGTTVLICVACMLFACQVIICFYNYYKEIGEI